MSNFDGIINGFSKSHNVVVPILPIFDLPIRKVSVAGLVDYVSDFVTYKGFDKVNVLGNSLGGHISILFALANPEKQIPLPLLVALDFLKIHWALLFQKRGDYDFIKTKTEDIFYDPKTATKELVDEVYDTVNDRNKAIRIVATAKSAVRHNLSDKLHLLRHQLYWFGEMKIV